jgi:hypothetical protein
MLRFSTFESSSETKQREPKVWGFGVVFFPAGRKEGWGLGDVHEPPSKLNANAIIRQRYPRRVVCLTVLSLTELSMDPAAEADVARVDLESAQAELLVVQQGFTFSLDVGSKMGMTLNPDLTVSKVAEGGQAQAQNIVPGCRFERAGGVAVNDLGELKKVIAEAKALHQQQQQQQQQHEQQEQEQDEATPAKDSQTSGGGSGAAAANGLLILVYKNPRLETRALSSAAAAKARLSKANAAAATLEAEQAAVKAREEAQRAVEVAASNAVAREEEGKRAEQAAQVVAMQRSHAATAKTALEFQNQLARERARKEVAAVKIGNMLRGKIARLRLKEARAKREIELKVEMEEARKQREAALHIQQVKIVGGCPLWNGGFVGWVPLQVGWVEWWVGVVSVVG